MKRGTIYIKKYTGIVIGSLLVLVGAFFLLGIWFSRKEDEYTPVYIYIALTLAFGVLILSGVALIVLAFQKSTKLEQIVENSYMPEIPDSSVVNMLIEELEKRTRKEAIKINLDYETKPKLTDSKIGGVPYWDRNRKYPIASNGVKLELLAQFNLSQLPENNAFPKEGMLQFFILNDDLYGMACPDLRKPSAYRVVYHNTIDETVTEEEVLSLGITTSLDAGEDHAEFPVVGEFAVHLEKKYVSMNDNDVRFDALMHRIAVAKGIQLDKNLHFYEMFEEDDERYDSIHEATKGHWLMGYPYFTQDDFRSMETEKWYDTMLFQLDTDDRTEYPNKGVMWGDSGVGAFFINSKKLADLDFDDVLYNWDCC